jgi:hypothetical protein
LQADSATVMIIAITELQNSVMIIVITELQNSVMIIAITLLQVFEGIVITELPE